MILWSFSREIKSGKSKIFFVVKDVLSDRLAKVNDKRGNETASVQMLISCAILPQNANGCSPASVDTAWRFISGINGGINNG